MLILRGAPALSNFRNQKLLNSLQEKVPEITAVVAEFQHFVKTSSELSREHNGILTKLLTYGPKISRSTPDNAASESFFLTIPRPGTISPWSSKATDIAHNCGLDNIRRIERGIAYRVYAGVELNPEQQQRVRLSICMIA